MTGDNRRRNLADEWARSEECLRAAEALVALGLHADAITRAYYVAYHVVRALLLSRGVEPRTHAGSIHLFNTELVRSGLMPSSHNRVLAGLQRMRELADYDAAAKFSADDAKGEVDAARAFASEAAELLRREGWLP